LRGSPMPPQAAFTQAPLCRARARARIGVLACMLLVAALAAPQQLALAKEAVQPAPRPSHRLPCSGSPPCRGR